MKKEIRIIYIWTIGNILLLIRYLIDPLLILCEPCIPDYPCLPCRTEFAKVIWIYFLIWNLLAGIIFLIIKKKTFANNVS